MTYPQQPPQGPPGPPEPALSAKLSPLTAIGFLGATGLAFGAYLWLNGSGSGGHELQGVAVFQDLASFRICAAQELSGCRVRYGSLAGRDLLVDVQRLEPAVSCDSQLEQATAACASAADQPARQRCLAERGVVEVGLASRGDPRDEHLPPGQFELLCTQGVKRGAFANPTF